MLLFSYLFIHLLLFCYSKLVIGHHNILLMFDIKKQTSVPLLTDEGIYLHIVSLVPRLFLSWAGFGIRAPLCLHLWCIINSTKRNGSLWWRNLFQYNLTQSEMLELNFSLDSLRAVTNTHDPGWYTACVKVFLLDSMKRNKLPIALATYHGASSVTTGQVPIHCTENQGTQTNMFLQSESWWSVLLCFLAYLTRDYFSQSSKKSTPPGPTHITFHVIENILFPLIKEYFDACTSNYLPGSLFPNPKRRAWVRGYTTMYFINITCTHQQIWS